MKRAAKRKINPLGVEDQERVRKRLQLAYGLALHQFWLCGEVMPLAELNGEASFALADAASRYQEERNVPFGAYATLVIRHRLLQAITEWRRGGRLAFPCFSDLATEDPGDCHSVDVPCRRTREPWEEAYIQEVLDRLRQNLPPQFVEVLELVYLHGYTFGQIGIQKGLERKVVKQMVAKALKRARKLWRKEKVGA